MKKFIACTTVCAIALIPLFFCTGCEVSNVNLANSLEGNLTKLVYTASYLDSVNTEELSAIVNNSSYFTNSSLYNGGGVATLNSPGGNAVGYTANSLGAGNNTIGCENYNTGIVGDNAGLSNFGTATGNCDTCGSALNTGDASATVLGGLTNANIGNLGGCETGAFGELAANADNYSTSLTNGFASTNMLATGLNGNNISGTGNFADGAITTVNMTLIENSATDLNNLTVSIGQKRSIIMLYCSDLRAGSIVLTAQDKNAINEYIIMIKEITNYLNNTSGVLTGYLENLKSISLTENAQEFINAKLIRATDLLKTRYAKLETIIESLDAIINIFNNYGYTNYSELYLGGSAGNLSNSSLNSGFNNVNTSENIINSETNLGEPVVITQPNNLLNNIENSAETNTTNCCPNCNCGNNINGATNNSINNYNNNNCNFGGLNGTNNMFNYGSNLQAFNNTNCCNNGYNNFQYGAPSNFNNNFSTTGNCSYGNCCNNFNNGTSQLFGGNNLNNSYGNNCCNCNQMDANYYPNTGLEAGINNTLNENIGVGNGIFGNETNSIATENTNGALGGINNGFNALSGIPSESPSVNNLNTNSLIANTGMSPIEQNKDFAVSVSATGVPIKNTDSLIVDKKKENSSPKENDIAINLLNTENSIIKETPLETPINKNTIEDIVSPPTITPNESIKPESNKVIKELGTILLKPPVITTDTLKQLPYVG